jgi:hypothetical protein
VYRQRIVPRANVDDRTAAQKAFPSTSSSFKRSDVSSRAHPRGRILCGAAVELGTHRSSSRIVIAHTRSKLLVAGHK